MLPKGHEYSKVLNGLWANLSKTQMEGLLKNVPKYVSYVPSMMTGTLTNTKVQQCGLGAGGLKKRSKNNGIMTDFNQSFMKCSNIPTR